MTHGPPPGSEKGSGVGVGLMFVGLAELQADNVARSRVIYSNVKIMRFDGGYMLQAPDIDVY